MSSPDPDNGAAQAAPSAEASETMPERIARRYAISRVLGRGGFGAVFEARDELEDRMVAVKLIRRDADASSGPPDSSRGSAASRGPGSELGRSGARRYQTRSFGPPSTHGDNLAQAFKDEFRLLTQLHHPNLAAVYDFGRDVDTDSFFFTQELVQGVELTAFMADAPRETIVEVFVQLARALDYIHALGLVHGDIKPSNVLVTAAETVDGQPEAKLIDFGLARMPLGTDAAGAEIGPDGTVFVVLAGLGVSTPEKVRGQSTDARSDIYSLAATFYTAIRGGQRAFPGKTFKEALRAQKDWRPELAGALLSQAGPVVAELIGRMLQPSPDDRPQSARAIVLELLRREASHLRDRQQSEADRREFARVLVEHLPFVDRAHYLELLLDKAGDIIARGHGKGGEEGVAAAEPDAAASSSANALASLSSASLSAASSSASLAAMRRGGRLIRTVVVQAPEGMGKGRLFSELRREIQLGDGLFVSGSAWSSDQSAFGPFASVISQLATALGERSAAVRRFKRLVAAARSGTGGANEADQIAEFLLACAEEHPYVLYLSDLSRGHESLRVAFDMLCRGIDHSEAPILFCATTEPHSKINPILAALGRDQIAEVWSLRPFTSREMFAVLHGVLGDTPTLKELSNMLDKLTGGHPLSFRETLRVLIEESILVREADNWVLRGASAAAEELHKTLAQRSESRLDGLGASGWELGSILYLVEAPIPEEQLAELSDLRSTRFKRTLDRLEGEGIVTRSVASGSSMVALAHESVREAVRGRYAESLDETRLDLAERIEELETDDPNLAFLRARLLDDADPALESVDALEAAADSLFERSQPQLAAQVLDRLIRRLRRNGGKDGLERLLRAQLKLLNQAAGALDDPRVEVAHYEAGILVAELLQDHRAQALFWLGLVDRYTSSAMSDIEVALDRLDFASEAAERADDRVLQLRISNRRAEVLLSAGEIEKASRWSREAMQILDVEDANAIDICHIVGVRLRCLSLSGQLGEARRLHETAKPIAKQCPVVQRQSYLSGIAYLAVLGGDPVRAIPEIEKAIEELQAANLPRLLLTPLHNVGDLRLRNDDVEGAEAAFREAIRLASVYGFDYHVHLNRGFLGYVMARRGDPEEGAALLQEGKDGLLATSGEHMAVQQLRLLDAEVAHMLGQSARARRELEEMLADFHAANELSLAHWAQEALARIERDLGTAFIETPDDAGAESDPEQDTVRTKPVRD